MNGLLELELWRIIGQGNDEIRGGYSGGGRGWVPQPQCPTKRDIISNVLWVLLLGRLDQEVLGKVNSMSSLDHPHMQHTQDTLWGHLTNKGEGRYLRSRVEEAEIGKVAESGTKALQQFEGEYWIWRWKVSSSLSPMNSSVLAQCNSKLRCAQLANKTTEAKLDHSRSSNSIITVWK
ncbi:hypothetical protein GOBAR_AA26252 [Gossypium barbadense]|uniref:Uncharacterized protein n=1 Tax=Gossypium barbadense TaxID=3634 RepID=A0A2P5WTL0_GOSBA|nr:hypothetical protein GOBAR_AA26252 [Gossypium barbadense]